MLTTRSRPVRGDLTVVDVRTARVAGSDLSIGSIFIVGLAAVGAFFLYQNFKVTRR